MIKDASCLACFARLDELGRRGEAAYGRCPGCGSVQLLEIPDDEALAALYADSYHAEGHYHASAEEHRTQRSRVCQQVFETVMANRSDSSRGRVVELGAGWGSLGRLFVDAGVPYLGIEPNEVMAEAAERAGVPMQRGSVSDLSGDELLTGEVETIVSMAVFEHLPHPARALRAMAERVAPGGQVVIQCPTAGIPRVIGGLVRTLAPRRELPGFFGSLAPPWHVFLPSPAGMRALAGRSHLEVRQTIPSRSGRARDARRFLQSANEAIARVGHAAIGERWPFGMAHVFVLARPG